MNRKNILLLILVGFFFRLSPALCVDVPAAPVEVPPPGIEPSLNQIRELEDAGKYLEAQKEYESLLNDSTLDQSDYGKIRADYEKLNMKMLFSRFEGEGSKFYTVEPGDSLYVIAKKYETTVELIKKSNGLTKDTIYPDMKLKIITDRFSVGVDKSENVLTLFLNDKPLKHYSVATGKGSSTPTGKFKIVNKLKDPTWYRAGAVVPPDSPENILGTRWLGFDYPGYGIHGTTLPETIGKQESSGCIRMFNEDVEELYSILPHGAQVFITD